VNEGAEVRPQTPDSIVAQIMKRYRGQHVGLLAPLVMNRKGVYTELADWARPRGYSHLRVDGNFLPTTNFPRIDRFKEHTIELPVCDLDVTPGNEALLREKLTLALEHGKGIVHVLAPLDGLRSAFSQGVATHEGIGKVEVFSTLRACSRTTASMAGAPSAWAPASGSRASSARRSTTPWWPPKTRGASRPSPSRKSRMSPTKPVPPATGGA
jgi:excinuclease ABC subunit A